MLKVPRRGRTTATRRYEVSPVSPATPTPATWRPGLGGRVTPKVRMKIIRDLFEVKGCILAAESCELNAVGSTLIFTSYACLAAAMVWMLCHGLGVDGRASGVAGLLLGLVVGSGLFAGDCARSKNEAEKHKGTARRIVEELRRRYPVLFAGFGEGLARDAELVRLTRGMIALTAAEPDIRPRPTRPPVFSGYESLRIPGPRSSHARQLTRGC